jgi:hypothetical protein
LGNVAITAEDLVKARTYLKRIEELARPVLEARQALDRKQEKAELLELKQCLANHRQNMSAGTAYKLAAAAVKAERKHAIKPARRRKIINNLLKKHAFQKAVLEGAYGAAAGGSKLQANFHFKLCRIAFQESPNPQNAYQLANSAVWALSRGAISSREFHEVMETLAADPACRVHALLGAYTAAKPGTSIKNEYKQSLFEALKEMPIELPVSLSAALGEREEMKPVMELPELKSPEAVPLVPEV